jgi:glycosyltransferase involved in cell wall biosynthesis
MTVGVTIPDTAAGASSISPIESGESINGESVDSKKPISATDLRLLQPIALSELPAAPSVSVLITCFNYGKFVGNAIESVLAQTYAAQEIIVSDDASEDDSCAVVQGYIDRGLPIRLLRNAHGGMAANLNAAYRDCDGEVICLLDADDTFLPGKLEAVVNAFREHARAGFAIHRASMVDDQKRPRGIYPLLSALPSGDCASAVYRNSGILMGLPPTTNLALRRQVAERIFPIPIEYTGYAEQIFHRLAPLMTEVCAIDAPLAHWRLHGKNDQNSTHIQSRRMDRELKIMDSLWLQQQRYLAAIDAHLASSFPPLRQNPMYLKMDYTRLRLNNDPAMHAAYEDLCRYGLQANSKVDRFWRYSNRLPRPLFQKAVDLLMTQGVVKQMVTRVMRGKQPV